MIPLARTLALAVLLLILPALLLRPVLPIDETRYLAVAWEMYREGNWLVPHLNGEPYSHKPPLLFWLVAGLWQMVGPVEWAARLVAPGFGLAGLGLTAMLGRRLWAGDEGQGVAAAAAIVLAAMLLWAVFSTLTMFDTMLAVFALVGAHGLLDLREARWWRGILFLALAMAFGVLAKGPVIAVHLLAAALAARVTLGGWPRRHWTWLGLAGIGLLLGAALALLWAVPAARQGGPAYADAIFLEQSAGRMVESFAHRRPVWWYIALLPLAALPWCLMPRLWRGACKALARPDPGLRFCLLWFLAGLIVFSLISGKQVHYLLPLLPALALALARTMLQVAAGAGDRIAALFLPALASLGFLALAALDRSGILPQGLALLPDWVKAASLPLGIAATFLFLGLLFLPGNLLLPALASMGLVAAVHVAAGPHARPYYDLRPIGRQVATLQAEGRQVAFAGHYQGQLDFAGRLRQPLVVLAPDAMLGWARENPDGILLLVPPRGHREMPPPLFLQPYRGRVIGLWEAGQASAIAWLPP